MTMGGLAEKMKTVAKDSVGTAKDAAGGMGTASMDKVNEWLDEFNSAMILLDEFGFKVDKFSVGSGLVPAITTSIVGSLSSIDTDAVDKAIAEHEGRTIVVTLMKSVRTAKQVRERVSSLPFSDVRIDVTLGWPPDISLDFI